MIRKLLPLLGIPLISLGCVASPATTQPVAELTPSQKEGQFLTEITQLTFGRDYERAGEAYFSADGRWVVFQAIPKPRPGEKAETGYQMYVARLVYVQGKPSGLVVATRITPPNSKNTCGWFSPDGKTLLFASTAGKEDPDEGPSGYQRAGSRYRWAFSKGMEIYSIPNWEQRVMTASAGGYVNLALPEHRLTNNDYYDAECSFSPDGEWIVFCSDRPSDVEADAMPTTRATTNPSDAVRPKQLYVMRKDGSDVRQLTATPGYNGGPFFSPNGKQLLYRSDRKGNDLLQVLLADIEFKGPWYNKTHEPVGLKNERPLSDDTNVNWAPYLTPDAKHVLFASSKVAHTNYEVFAVSTIEKKSTDGKTPEIPEPTRITYAAGADVLPVVSFDGKYMMWASKRGEDPTTQIYIATLKLHP